MNRNKIILPFYYVQKKSKFSFNEKNLIIILITATVVSIFFILKNLPGNVNFQNNDNNGDEPTINVKDIDNFFVPKFNLTHHQNRLFIHDESKHKQKLPNKINNENPNQNNNDDYKKIESKTDLKNKRRRDKIKEMTMFAWNGYKKYAWGKNELKPISKTGHLAGIFGHAENLGATIIDSLDTLYLMGFHEEVKLGRDWIENNFKIQINTELSAFEINIRYVGGFLALYTFTKDKLYLDKAEEVATALLPIFNSPTGIPYSLVNPITKNVQNYNWASGSCSILAEYGTLSLEFQYLSDLTGNKIFQEKIDKMNEALEKTDRPEGLYYNYINPSNGQWCGNNAGIGGLADSFYEYLLKLWLYKDKSDKKLLKTYLDAMNGVREKLIRKSNNNFVYTGEYASNYLSSKMGHLACYTGGLFALTAMYVNELTEKEKFEYENLAKNITQTCHQSYVITKTHLGPESFSFFDNQGPVVGDRYYILRPEVIESYFYLWRMTKNPIYRDWAWDAAMSIEKHCKAEAGYSGIRDVDTLPAEKDDVQQSFFFAETLKYLYLIFSDDNAVPLNDYVFNTEAHPFLIKKSS